MSTLRFNIKSWLLYLPCCFGLLLGCDNNYLVEKASAPLTEDSFYKQSGYKLDFDLYLPNSYTGWNPTIYNKFTYDADKQLYVLNNLDISKAPIDNYGQRFKITSKDWQHEFGFTNTNSFIEESKFGLVNNRPSIFKVKYYSVLADSKDLYFELPHNANPSVLNIKLKVTSEATPQQAWLMVSYVEK
ncbi:hypothetical protein KO525_10320 [Psychrosphaera sp. B3R10]|uniref:hypothetical protein n=1 Tax=unclassified Psychrosphaera TaxID=2641570 RepID=UPI001C09C3BA|nr:MULTISPECIES: hypothetical protein [unclassified Psychrosphaera]MBU2883594.1 hypothetical protein [Psychrosphaera sp. I2R16]MBU2989772.1 hypothetical protein [Psychrosphaera sp. B3R10]